MEDKDKIQELIDASSFGTEEAKLLIERVPKGVAEAIVEEVKRRQGKNK